MDVYTQAVAPAKHAAQAAVLALFFPITMSEDEETIIGTAYRTQREGAKRTPKFGFLHPRISGEAGCKSLIMIGVPDGI